MGFPFAEQNIEVSPAQASIVCIDIANRGKFRAGCNASLLLVAEQR